MAQSGMHIPAQSGSELSIFDDVFADIGDEQSIEQSLSTFSGHLTNIVNILKEADDRSLVIFDELGAGTDPQEGSSLAMAILNNLLKKNITTFVATHYPELKTFAHNTLAVTNASLEFDVATLRPTYRLTIGLPGRSNALAIASRLGLPDEIIQDAKQGINPENLKADKLLDDIRRERNKASKEREKVTKTRQKNEALNNDLATRLEKIEDERLETINKAKAEAELELEILKRNIGRLRAEMKKLHMTTGDVDKLEKKVEKISEKSQQPEVRKKVVEEPTKDVKFKLGEKIYVRNLDKVGILTSLAEEEGEVQIGNIRIRTKLTEIQKVSEIEKPALTTLNSRQQRIKKAANNITISADANIKMSYSLPSPGIELDIRGKTSEDGLSLLGDYIDRAYLSGLPFARIIHGKGTGKLRQEVRSYLSGNEQVSSIEEGHPNEGGDGVTIVKFIKD
jgi:DNA mismatch repair protein MutS2